MADRMEGPQPPITAHQKPRFGLNPEAATRIQGELAEIDAKGPSGAPENPIITAADELAAKIHRDKLTGLYNQDYLRHQLENFNPNTDNSLGIIFMDLNFLKRVNDNYGHELGDTLIKGAAEVLRKTFRSEDVLSFVSDKTESQNKADKNEEILSRRGGDELVALCPNSNNNPDFSTIFPKSVHGRLLENISEFNKNHPELPIPLSISFGVVVYDKNMDSSNAFNTLHRAENAMKAHKRSMKAGRE